MQLCPLWGGLGLGSQGRVDSLVLTDFGHCVRSQFRTLRPQLLAGDALPPWVVTQVLQRIGSAAALTCCPIVPEAAYDTLWRDASGQRGAARPRAAFDSM